MKSIAVFNNKGGVGKTTLSFHTAHAIAESGKKVLIIDLDPQCNFSIFSLKEEFIEKIWGEEEPFIDGFQRASEEKDPSFIEYFLKSPRSAHFLLKPSEEGINDIEVPPTGIKLSKNLHFIPGRLSLHMYEDKLSSRWSDVFVGDDLALRTVTSIRTIAERYSRDNAIDVVIYDTSPSLGMLNRIILSMSDGFVIPCNPDLFSLYGIKNIGRSLTTWSNNFRILSQVLPPSRRNTFSQVPVKFLGYTIYKATKYAGQNEWDLATGHYNYAKQIPKTIHQFIREDIRADLPDDVLNSPIGGTSVMHSHQTMATMSQKYKCPIWMVPDGNLDGGDRNSIHGNANRYRATRDSYGIFAKDLLHRMESL